jgi:ribosomal protein S18 acetylase RimI-like enzyme
MSNKFSSRIVRISSKPALRKGKNHQELSFRPFDFTESDYEAIVAVENANYPDAPSSSNEFRFYDETRDPKYLFERILAEENGRVVGFAKYGQPWWSFEEGKYFFGIEVHPDWHDKGVAEALYEQVMEALRDCAPTQLISDCVEDQQYIVNLLGTEDYKAVMRVPRSELDVQLFDGSRFAVICNRVRDAGIRVDNLAVIATQDANWKRKLWHLEWELLQDVPTPAPLTRMPFEQWQKRFLGSPNFTFDGQTVAREGDRFVGMSGIWTSEADPKKLYTGLTGVVRSYRRRGIATAMKVNGIRFAQSKGIEVIETDNEENNPMLDLNKQLGFKEKPAFVCYEKELERIEPVEELLKEPL